VQHTDPKLVVKNFARRLLRRFDGMAQLLSIDTLTHELFVNEVVLEAEHEAKRLDRKAPRHRERQPPRPVTEAGLARVDAI
jgi:hypothetical protein